MMTPAEADADNTATVLSGPLTVTAGTLDTLTVTVDDASNPGTPVSGTVTLSFPFTRTYLKIAACCRSDINVE
jgi:hypothetical protein